MYFTSPSLQPPFYHSLYPEAQSPIARFYTPLLFFIRKLHLRRRRRRSLHYIRARYLLSLISLSLSLSLSLSHSVLRYFSAPLFRRITTSLSYQRSGACANHKVNDGILLHSARFFSPLLSQAPNAPKINLPAIRPRNYSSRPALQFSEVNCTAAHASTLLAS